MGSKDTISERRLRPVYDFLDSGNNRKAIQEADRVLKKHPDLLCAKALKALANVRLTKSEDAWPLIEDVEKENSNDEHTLQALSHCYKELARPDRIATLYESAVKRLPRSEDLLSQLFMAYVRVRDYKRQQQTAMQLYKEYPKNPYYFWAIMSIYMQAINDPKLGDSMFLPLAEKMLSKFIQDDKIQAEAEVHLWCLILNKRGKCEELLGVLEGPLGEKYLNNLWNRQYQIMDLQMQLENYERVVDECCKSLPQKPDDWNLYKNLFSSALALAHSCPERKSDLMDRVTDVIIACLSNTSVRGPHLARLEWIVALLERDLVVRCELGEPTDLLIEYFEIFGAKPCCFNDMRPYLWLLGEQQQSEFLNSIAQIAGFPCRESSVNGAVEKYCQTSSEVYRHLCCVQLCRCLGVHTEMDAASKLRLAKECLMRRTHALKMSQKSGADTHPSDAYVLMAVQLMWDVYAEQGDVHLLNEMVLALELAFGSSPSNFQFQLILAKLYAMLGAGQCVLKALDDTLSIKYMQKDMLGYFVIDNLGPFGLYSDFVAYLFDLNTYFTNSERELLEALTTAYRNGAFRQIPDVMEYQQQSFMSVYRVGTDILRRYMMVVGLCQGVDATANMLLPELEPVDWTSVRDNRDFRIIDCWDPGDVETSRNEEIKTSYQQLTDTLKLHQLVLRVLSLLCQEIKEHEMSPSSRPSGDQSAHSHLRTLSSQLKAHYRHCRNTHCDPSVPSLQGPVASTLHLYLQGGYFELLDCLLDCSYLVAGKVRSGQSDNEQCSQDNCDHSPDRMHSLPTVEHIQGLLRRMLSSHQLAGVGGAQSPPVPPNGCRPPLFPHLQLCHISWTLQTVSIGLLFCLCVQQLLPKPLHQTQAKKTKKKQANKVVNDRTNGVSSPESGENCLSSQFHQLTEVLCSAPETVGRLLDDLNMMLMDADFKSFGITRGLVSESDLDDDHVAEARAAVEKKMRQSYTKSIEQLRQCVRHQQNDLVLKLMHPS